MKKYILLAITALCLQDMQAQTVVHPSIKTKTTFAIVVDQKSYDEAPFIIQLVIYANNQTYSASHPTSGTQSISITSTSSPSSNVTFELLKSIQYNPSSILKPTEFPLSNGARPRSS